MMKRDKKPQTVAELRQTQYQVLPVREEIRRNLMQRIKDGKELFPGIVGYE